MPTLLALADDHPLALAGLKQFLEDSADLRVVVQANNGQQLLEQLEEQKVDVVLLDLSMPVMDGYQTLERLRDEHPALPALIYTFELTDEVILRSMRLGARGCLDKALEPPIFPQAVQHVLQSGYYITPRVQACQQANPDGRTAAEREREAVLAAISERELAVLQRTLAPDEPTMQAVGADMGISDRTVESHLRNVARKAGVKSRTGLALWAARMGLVK